MNTCRLFRIPNIFASVLCLILLPVPASSEESPPSEGTHERSEAANEVYTCSMHPQVRLTSPGDCPICGMKLILAASAPDRGEPMLKFSEHALAMADVETAPVSRRPLEKEIRAFGKVDYNERSLATITSRVDGYVERLFVDYTGIQIRKGDHLVEIYSPDLVVAQDELLITLRNRINETSIEKLRLKLLRWGVTPEQIDELVKSGKASDRLTIFSPIDGTVIEKMIVENSAVKAGDVLYRVADLSTVWVYLDIYEYEAGSVRYGQPVEITTETYPGEVFKGVITFINPVLNEETRTIRVPVILNNPGLRLKPGMYVTATIRAKLLADGAPAPSGLEGQYSCPMHPQVIAKSSGKCSICGMNLAQIPKVEDHADSGTEPLAVPASAVLDSGTRKLVYVEHAPGKFAPVEVLLGPKAGGYFPVLQGLSEGNRVAVRGNFLLDSQFQIIGLPSLFRSEGEASPQQAGHKH